MEEYASEFYIHMIKYLWTFERSKGCWVSRVKYIRLDTIKSFLRPILRNKKIKERVLAELSSTYGENPEVFGTIVNDCD